MNFQRTKTLNAAALGAALLAGMGTAAHAQASGSDAATADPPQAGRIDLSVTLPGEDRRASAVPPFQPTAGRPADRREAVPVRRGRRFRLSALYALRSFGPWAAAV